MDESLLEKALLETMDEMLFGEEFDMQLPPFVPSEKFQKKILKLQNNYNKPSFKLLHSRSKRAVIVLVAILILLLSSLSVGAVREAISEFFITHFSNHASIAYNENSDNEVNYPETIENVYKIDVPNGFELVDNTITDVNVSSMYFGEDDKMILFIQLTKSEFATDVDNEHSVITKENICGQDYIISESKIGKNYGIIWDNSEYIFSLDSSNLTKEETISICQTLRIAENK